MKRLDQLNFFRFVAAMLIVVYHYAKNTWPFTFEPWKRIPNGDAYIVSFFFVLSGFVIAYTYYRKAQEGINWKSFMIKRLSRFYPLYLASLILIFPFRFGESHNTLTGAGLYIAMLQSWLPPYPTTFNTPAWAMSVFFAIYMIFPALLTWMYRRKTGSLFFFTGIFWLTSQIVVHLLFNLWYMGADTFLHDFILYNPLIHLNSFLVGVFMGVYYLRRGDTEINQKWNRIALIFSLLAGVVFIFVRMDLKAILPFKLRYSEGLMAPVYALIILLLAQDQTAISKFLSKPILVAVGDLSFSIYLLQTPVVDMYKSLILPRLERYIPWTANWHFYFYFVLLMAAAIISRHWFEKPLQRLIRRRLI